MQVDIQRLENALKLQAEAMLASDTQTSSSHYAAGERSVSDPGKREFRHQSCNLPWMAFLMYMR